MAGQRQNELNEKKDKRLERGAYFTMFKGHIEDLPIAMCYNESLEMLYSNSYLLRFFFIILKWLKIQKAADGWYLSY